MWKLSQVDWNPWNSFLFIKDLTPNTGTVKLGPGRDSRDNPLVIWDLPAPGAAQRGSPGHLQRRRLYTERERERALDSGISVPAWGLDYSLCPCPGLVANIFQMKSFHNGRHQADAGRERDEVVTPAERNIHLTEYLVYQICKCRVLEYFVCAHLKFGNILYLGLGYWLHLKFPVMFSKRC